MAPKHSVDQSGLEKMVAAWRTLPDAMKKDHAGDVAERLMP